MQDESETGASEVEAMPDAAKRIAPDAPKPGTRPVTSQAGPDETPDPALPESARDLKW